MTMEYFNMTWSLLIIAGAIIGSILPDGDHQHSPAGLVFPFWIFFKHRTWTHSIWILIIEAATTLYFYGSTLLFPFMLGITIGTFTHLLIDSFTKSGIKLFYGLSNRSYGIKLFRADNEGSNHLFTLLGLVMLYKNVL